ncbi:MAG: 3-oxoacid CoA-transferase subunit A, partial [Rhodospirillaceae bacterium]|nr:3-oxoacid CoA-transferase subunit A [Rhodospirillaceae bacterium]
MAAGRVRKMICSFPRSVGSVVFPELYAAGKIELEVVPQGTLSERIRAGGAGLGGFYTPTGVGTQVADGKEVRSIDGKDYLLELPIRGDVALVKAHTADRFGNLTYRKAARNYGPSMAMAGRRTVAEIDDIHAGGGLDPERIVTPGIFVDAVVRVDR